MELLSRSFAFDRRAIRQIVLQRRTVLWIKGSMFFYSKILSYKWLVREFWNRQNID